MDEKTQVTAVFPLWLRDGISSVAVLNERSFAAELRVAAVQHLAQFGVADPTEEPAVPVAA